jgi:hypothetical protein
VGEHHIAGRVAHRLTDAFEENQRGSHVPAPSQGHKRHGRHLDHIADDRDRPELAGPVAEPPRDQAQAVPQQLAKARDDRHDRRTGAEHSEIGPKDPPRALVGEIREKAHDADQQDKLQRRDLRRRWFHVFTPRRASSDEGPRVPERPPTT